MHADAWHYTTIVQCLDSPVHSGQVHYHGEILPGAHQGIVDVETWDAYRRVRGVRASERRVKRRYLLSGIAVCECGAALGGYQISPSARNRQRAPFVGYRCTAFGRAEGHGPRWSISRHVVEDAVLVWLREVAADVENVAVRSAVDGSGARLEAQRIAREITGLDRQLGALTEHLVSGLVPESAYASTRDGILARRRRLEAGLAAAERLIVTVPDDPSRIARELLADWDTLPLDARRSTLRSLISHVKVEFEARRAVVVPVWSTVRDDA
jgi:hypothetical protein